jgi:hypothetical protein
MAEMTEAQRDLLGILGRRQHTTSAGYRPALKLVDLGYAAREAVPGRLIKLSITPAGRAALDKAGGGA